MVNYVTVNNGKYTKHGSHGGLSSKRCQPKNTTCMSTRLNNMNVKLDHFPK